jgi:hypothetical protein
MSVLSKIIATTVLGAGAVAGWSYVKNLKKAQAELQVLPKASLYQLSWDGLTIRVDVLLKNPTKGSFSVKFPFVSLLYKDTTIGSSQAQNREIKVPQYGEVMIDSIMVQIPMISAFSVVFTLIKALFNKEAVALTIRTLTHINLGWVVLPYENKQQVTIKKN